MPHGVMRYVLPSFYLLVAIGILPILGCKEPVPVPKSVESASMQTAAVQFAEVTSSAGLSGFQHETGAFGEKWFPETMGAGCGFFDYNQDGWLDVVLVGGGTWPGHRKGQTPPAALRLYRNNQDGTFTEVTRKAGLADLQAYGFGVAAADYDNDGDQDILFTTLRENMLLRNEKGVFVRSGQEAGLAEHSSWSSSSIFFDADRDGWLDLYVGNYVDWTPKNDIWCSLSGTDKAYCTPEAYEGVPSRYYHNEGSGTFVDRTKEAGFLPAPGKTLGVAALDYDNDNWPDLAVANDMERNLLYGNNQDGTFTERGLASGIAFDENGKARAGMGIDVGNVDSSGHPSIFVGNLSHEMIGVYRYIGNDLFIDRAAVSKIGRPSLLMLTFGLFLFDADLDGDLDLFAANGHLQSQVERIEDRVTYRQRPQFFLNDGEGTFKEAKGVFSEPIVARGAAYGDYDHDGDLDVLVVENGGAAHLWRNDTKGGHFLRVRLEGRKSNRDGIGSEVVAVVGKKRLERRVRTGSSYLSQSEKVVTFGLGGARKVDSLVVRWPSGEVDRLASVKANQQVRIVEGGQQPKITSHKL